MKFLLREILEELRTHHRYVRDRDAKLDALDEQQRNKDAERRANNDALMQESLAAQMRGLEMVKAATTTPMPDWKSDLGGGRGQ